MSSFWQDRRLLISITTYKINWRRLIEQINDLKLREVALFLTCLEFKEREELFNLLEKSSVTAIPFVHLKSTMKPKELEYLMMRFKTKAFNLHSQKQYPHKYDLSKYKKRIFVENVYSRLEEKEVKNYAGICFDLNHLEETKYFNKLLYEHNLRIINKYPIGCNHLSPLRLDVKPFQPGNPDFDDKYGHIVTDLSQFDYLKNYDRKYYGPFIALEVRSDFYQQIKIKEYISRLLATK